MANFDEENFGHRKLGNVGSYVFKGLMNLGLTPIGTTSNPLQMSKSDLVHLDFLKHETFLEALKDVDGVFLMRPPHIGDPKDLFPFIAAVKKQNVKLLVFLSLMGIEKNTIPPHYKIEKYIEEMKIPFCHIRPGFFMQNLSGTHSKEILNNDEIYIPASSSKCSFIDTQDIGDVIAKIFSDFESHQNLAYTITGSESLDYFQVADVMTKVLGRKIKYGNPALISFWSYMVWKRSFPVTFVNVMCALYVMTRFGAGEAITDDFEKIMKRKPRSFEEFAKENRDAWEKR